MFKTAHVRNDPDAHQQEDGWTQNRPTFRHKTTVSIHWMTLTSWFGTGNKSSHDKTLIIPFT